MKTTIFAIACLATLAVARHDRDLRSRSRTPSRESESRLRSQNLAFSNWIAEQGRGYSSSQDYEQRRQNWISNDDLIEATNAKSRSSSDPDALKLRHNFMSDMTAEERKAHYGRNKSAVEPK